MLAWRSTGQIERVPDRRLNIGQMPETSENMMSLKTEKKFSMTESLNIRQRDQLRLKRGAGMRISPI